MSSRPPLRGDRPGTSFGPMTPDEVGTRSTGLRQNAMDVIQAVDRQYPPELRAAMQRNRDHAASEKLDLKALSGEHGVKVVGAGVYGLPGEDQVLVYLYETDAGRTARWYAPFSQEDVPVNGGGEQSEPKPAEPPAEPDGDEEPWPGYDKQSVAEIQERLAEDGVDFDAVADYEATHKNRKGVLDYIDQEG